MFNNANRMHTKYLDACIWCEHAVFLKPLWLPKFPPSHSPTKRASSRHFFLIKNFPLDLCPSHRENVTQTSFFAPRKIPRSLFSLTRHFPKPFFPHQETSPPQPFFPDQKVSPRQLFFPHQISQTEFLIYQDLSPKPILPHQNIFSQAFLSPFTKFLQTVFYPIMTFSQTFLSPPTIFFPPTTEDQKYLPFLLSWSCFFLRLQAFRCEQTCRSTCNSIGRHVI